MINLHESMGPDRDRTRDPTFVWWQNENESPKFFYGDFHFSLGPIYFYVYTLLWIMVQTIDKDKYQNKCVSGNGSDPIMEW